MQIKYNVINHARTQNTMITEVERLGVIQKQMFINDQVMTKDFMT